VLPGTNAFASEALLYFGLVSAAPRGSIVTLAAAIVALVGALAMACFVRLAGSIFLGAARTDAATHAHEAPILMRAPLFILATACIVLGLFPAAIAGALETIMGTHGVIAPFLHAIAIPLQLGTVATTLALAVLLAATRHSPRRPTWDCGYARPTPRMQYTARSLSEWFTTHLTPRFLRPAVRSLAPSGLHPAASAFATDVDEPFGDRLLQPLAVRWTARAMRLRWLQQGRLSLYLLYIFFTLILAVAWVVAFPYVARVSGGGR
jgi:hydrogenase-4 component B